VAEVLPLYALGSGSKGSAELKVLRILRLKKLQGEEIIGK